MRKVKNFLSFESMKLLYYSFFELYAMRASGFIPVIPLIVINKDTQLPMYIEGQAIIY